MNVLVKYMSLTSAILTLFLIMDPLGNIPLFLSALKRVKEKRRLFVILRENIFALILMVSFLFLGPTLLGLLHISEQALHISGGILLFIISIGMIFPRRHGIFSSEPVTEEPFIVPLAVPLVVGPSTIATISIFATKAPDRMLDWFISILAAWGFSTVILLLSAPLSRLLGKRGLVACERLMGMILTIVAVQMFLDGMSKFLN